jgi:hypothetical protein
MYPQARLRCHPSAWRCVADCNEVHFNALPRQMAADAEHVLCVSRAGSERDRGDVEKPHETPIWFIQARDKLRGPFGSWHRGIAGGQA